MMNNTLFKRKVIRPSIHFLDLMAKIESRNGKISNLNYLKTEHLLTVSFDYTFFDFSTNFTEELQYNLDNELVTWNTLVNGKIYSIFTE